MIAVLTDGSEGGKRGDGKDCCKINDLDDWYAFDEAVLRSAKPQTSEYNGGWGVVSDPDRWVSEPILPANIPTL